MPQGVYIENPDDGTKRVKPNADGSLNVGNFPASQPVSGSVSVSNFPATQPVSGTVGVNNFPATQPVSGTVAVSNFPVQGEAAPVTGDILRNSRTTTGTLFTVPSGRVWRGSAEVSCSISIAGNSVPNVTDGTTVIVQCEAVGLALTTVANATNIHDVYVIGPATLTFTAGASGSSSGSASGRLL